MTCFLCRYIVKPIDSINRNRKTILFKEQPAEIVVKWKQKLETIIFSRRYILLALSIILVSGLGLTAHAYILRGPHLLELMTQQYGSAKTLMVYQKVRFYDPESAEMLAEAEETLRYLIPYDFRSESTTQNATRIHLVSEGSVVTVVDEKIVANQETSFDLYKDILLYRTRELLIKRLTSLGLDTSLTCLGRFNGRIAIVLGSERPNEPVSQVWIDKETLRPMRWLLVSDSGDTPPAAVDIRYDEWRRVNQTWYPMIISIYNSGSLEREIQVTALRVNSSFPKRLFDTQLMEVQYLQSVAETADQSVDGELSEIEKTINEFRKRIEE